MDGFDVIKEINGQEKEKKEKEKKNKKSFKEKLKKFFKVCLWVLLALIGVPLLVGIFLSIHEPGNTANGFFISFALLEVFFYLFSYKKSKKETLKYLIEKLKKCDFLSDDSILSLYSVTKINRIDSDYFCNFFIKIFIIILGVFWLNTAAFVLLYLIHNTAFNANHKAIWDGLKDKLIKGEKIHIYYSFDLAALLMELFPKSFENKEQAMITYKEIFQEIKKDIMPSEKLQVLEDLTNWGFVKWEFYIKRDYTNGFETIYDVKKNNQIVFSLNVVLELFNNDKENEKIKHLLLENNYIDKKDPFYSNIYIELTPEGIKSNIPFEDCNYDSQRKYYTHKYIKKSFVPISQILNIFHNTDNLCKLECNKIDDFDFKKSILDLLKKYPHNKIKNWEDDSLRIKNNLFSVDIFYNTTEKSGFSDSYEFDLE